MEMFISMNMIPLGIRFLRPIHLEMFGSLNTIPLGI